MCWVYLLDTTLGQSSTKWINIISLLSNNPDRIFSWRPQPNPRNRDFFKGSVDSNNFTWISEAKLQWALRATTLPSATVIYFIFSPCSVFLTPKPLFCWDRTTIKRLQPIQGWRCWFDFEKTHANFHAKYLSFPTCVILEELNSRYILLG